MLAKVFLGGVLLLAPLDLIYMATDYVESFYKAIATPVKMDDVAPPRLNGGNCPPGYCHCNGDTVPYDCPG